MTRTDVLSGQSVQQVTYAGLPLYRFIFDDTPGDTEGANLFDPVPSPTGTWYLVDPRSGHPAPGSAQLRVEPGTDLLAVSMDNGFSDVSANVSFPVYTLSKDGGHDTASKENGRQRDCQSYCALIWQPVLTSGRPKPGPASISTRSGSR